MEWLSGADPTILAACPLDRSRFVGLGGTVLTTAALATMSVVFTAKIALGLSIGVALLLGAAWGLAITNLDRWMVSVSHRRERAMQNLAAVMPPVMQAQNRSDFATALRQDPRYAKIPELETQAAELVQIAYGTADGPNSADRRAVAARDLSSVNADLNRLRAQMNDVESRYAETSANNSGLLARIEALGRLTSRDGSLSTAYLGLIILLTLIDVLPVLVKFMMNTAPPMLYDRLVAQADRADAELILGKSAKT